MRKNTSKRFAPSIVAASSSEAEIVRIYCRAKKMLPAPPPRMAGTMSGVSVLYQPMRT